MKYYLYNNWLFSENRLIYASGAQSGGPGSTEDDEEEKEKEEEKSKKDKKKKEEEGKGKEKKEGKKEHGEAKPKGGGVEAAQKTIGESVQKVKSVLDMQRPSTPEGDKAIFESARASVDRINAQDKENNNEMQECLQKLVQDRKLTSEQAEAIYELEPTAIHDIESALTVKPGAIDVAGFEKKLQKLCEPLKEDKKALSAIFGFKRKELELMKDLQKQLAKSGEVIQRNLERVKREAERQAMLEQASNICGIRLEKGVELEYKEHGIIVKQTFPPIEIPVKHTKITDITWEKEAVEPRIHVEGENPMTLGNFTKWVNEFDVIERIANKGKLEGTLGLKEYGISLEPDTVIEYTVRARNKEGDIVKKPEKVKIEAINGDKIVLDSEVETLTENEAQHRSYERKSKSQKVLTFGEFAKWFRKREAWKELSLKELEAQLEKHNQLLNSRYGRDSAFYPPLKPKEGAEMKTSGPKGTHLKIAKKDEDGNLVLSDNTHYTPTQFLHWVRKNEIEPYSPKLEDDQALAELEKVDPKKAAIRREEIERARKEAEKKNEEARAKQEAEEKEKKERVEKLEEQEAEADRIVPEVKAGVLRHLWNQTTFISMKDMWTFGETIVDLIVRKHERRTKGRIGKLGKNLPWVFGPEFSRMKQAAEDEEVHHYEEAMKQWGVFQVWEALRNANSLDEAKACMITLCHKGFIRWDDEKMWEMVNRLRSQYGGPKYVTKKNYLDAMEENMDFWWGENQFSEWYHENNSKYTNKKKEMYEKGKQLEIDFKGTGGLPFELHNMIHKWEHGEYVDPQEFEGLIEYAILYGKSNAESKVYFLLKGMTAINPKIGLTLLPIDRVAAIEGEMLNRLPMLDFFVDPLYPKGIKGKINTKWTVADFRRIVEWFEKDPSYSQLEPGKIFSPRKNKNIRKFFWNRIVTNEWVLKRLEKGLFREPGNIDHDDTHFMIPFAGEETMETICQLRGTKPFFTPPGYANAYPGFLQVIKELKDDWKSPGEGDQVLLDAQRRKNMLRQCVKSMVRFDAIMDNRYKKEKDFIRLPHSLYEKEPVVDSTPVRVHQREMQKLIRKIAEVYGADFTRFFGDDLNYLFKKTGSIKDPAAKEEQKKVDIAIEEFGVKFDKLIQNCDPDLTKLKRAIEEADLTGMSGYFSEEEMKVRKAQAQEEAEARGEDTSFEVGL